MKYDAIIMGGGLSGLACGIALTKVGKRVAIVAGGQNTLQLFGGSFELLGCVGDKEVAHPIDAIEQLNDKHPYKKLGASLVQQLAAEAQALLADAGIATQGDATANHYRITPMGMLKPAWLTLDGMAIADERAQLPWKKVALIDLQGYIDYPIDYVAHGLRNSGVQVAVAPVALDAIKQARRSSSEMRATSLAKVLTVPAVVTQLAQAINAVSQDIEAVLLPSVMGLSADEATRTLAAQVDKPLRWLATLPPSVTGARINTLLRHYFQMLGGRLLTGDNAARVVLENDAVKAVYTTKLPHMSLTADHYVLATGSFMSRGLESNFERIYEPLLDLDVDAPAEREQWSHYGMMGDQPYMSCGVVTDQQLHPLKDGQPLTNLYAAGQVLAGHNPLVMGDGTGVSLVTALAVAKSIIGDS